MYSVMKRNKFTTLKGVKCPVGIHTNSRFSKDGSIRCNDVLLEKQLSFGIECNQVHLSISQYKELLPCTKEPIIDGDGWQMEINVFDTLEGI